jgi:hypothetical protein
MENVSWVLSIFIVVSLWFFPFSLILGSNRTSGKEKVFWLCALFIFSWFAWFAYFFVAPLNNE